MTNYTNVSARAMLVSLNISTWRGRKFDKRTTNEVNSDKHADHNAARVNTHLLVGAEIHRKVLLLASKAREEHYRQTLPWTDEGWRLLPTANFVAYTDTMRKVRAEFETAVQEFLDAYPEIRASASERLGKLYREEDFPTDRNARARFGWSTDFNPVPAAGDLRLDLPSDQIDLIEKNVVGRMETATREAMRGAWERLHEAVARIQKASGEDGVVRGNLIEHAREVCDILSRLNVADDKDLDAMRVRVERELTSIEPEDLRKDDKLRKDTEKRATAIIDAMGAFFTPASDEEAA